MPLLLKLKSVNLLLYGKGFNFQFVWQQKPVALATQRSSAADQLMLMLIWQAMHGEGRSYFWRVSPSSLAEKSSSMESISL